MVDRDIKIRTALGLGVIGVTLMLIPLMLNVYRGGAGGVGFDPRTQGSDLFFAVTYPASLSQEPLDGRLVLILSRDASTEPRFQVSAGPSGQQVFAVDAERWVAGQPLEVRDGVSGFPLPSLGHIPPGHYQIQGVLDRYETVSLPSGQVVRLPAGQGEGWNVRAGNLVSRPVEVYLDPRSNDVVRVDLSRTIPAPVARQDTERVRQLRLRSDSLSAFWGRDVFLEAEVHLPDGWVERPAAAYPLVVQLGMDPQGGADAAGAAGEDEGGGSGGGRAVLVRVTHPVPFGSPFRAVNSANLGPWGGALTHELIPEIERRFGGGGGAGTRALVGASEGGWEALATLVAYPDAWAGAWAVCPAAVDFRALAGIDLYGDRSAFHYDRAWGVTPRPGAMGASGAPSGTLEQEIRLERLLGSASPSGGGWDALQAAYSPRGSDGAPRPVWNGDTGVIDREVAAYWREHYDLRHVIARDWATLGPKLSGRLHVVVGDGDLDDPTGAAAMLRDFLGSTGDAGVRDAVRGGGFPSCARLAHEARVGRLLSLLGEAERRLF